MRRSPQGFTLVEVVIALLIGSILTSIALSGFGNARSRFAATGARNTFHALHARARAQAIEMGAPVRLMVYPPGDSVVLLDTADVRLTGVDFEEEFHVDLRSSAPSLRLCLTPRGYADTACNSFNTAARLEFWQGGDSATLQILPLGQLIY